MTQEGISFKLALRKNGLGNIDYNLMLDVIANDICSQLVKNKEVIDSTLVYKNMMKRIIRGTENKHSTNDTIKLYRKKLSVIIEEIFGEKRFKYLLFLIDLIFDKYDKEFTNGFSYKVDKFKITEIPQRFRKCIDNVYIIADEMLNNGELHKRFKNAKFLIFDEDINSGASLKLACDALLDKIDGNEKEVKCLVNAYSNTGF